MLDFNSFSLKRSIGCTFPRPNWTETFVLSLVNVISVSQVTYGDPGSSFLVLPQAQESLGRHVSFVQRHIQQTANPRQSLCDTGSLQRLFDSSPSITTSPRVWYGQSRKSYPESGNQFLLFALKCFLRSGEPLLNILGGRGVNLGTNCIGL